MNELVKELFKYAVLPLLVTYTIGCSILLLCGYIWK
jgi:hypothetical protein